MPRTRLSAALYLILVFASGILVGVVSHRLYMTTSVNASAAPRSMDEFRRRYTADMRSKVGANDTQIASVNQILLDTKRKFDDLHAQEKLLNDKISQEQHDAIMALLSPPQKVAFENWRAERARIHAEEQRKKQQQQK
jgi:hypothetical protein